VGHAPAQVALVDGDLVLRFASGPEDGRAAFRWLDRCDHGPLRVAVDGVRATGLPQHFVATLVAGDGTLRRFDNWVVASGREDRFAIVSQEHDGKRKVETELETARDMLRALIDDSDDSIVTVDASHRVEFAHRSALGRPDAELVGRPLETFYPEHHRAALREAIDFVFETGLATSFDLSGRSIRLAPLTSGGAVRSVNLVATDHTDGEQAREALRQSEERFRTLVEHSPDAIVIFDLDARTFATVNPRAEEFFGMSRDELHELGPVEVSPRVQPDGRLSEEAAEERIAAALAGDSPTFEWTHLNARGEEIPCEVCLVRLPDPDRLLVRGSITDISARKLEEAEKARLAERLQQAQKMEAVGQLTGGLAHDFNNLLTVILGNLELLREELGRDHELDEIVDMARAAGRRASALTHRLLAFARRQPLQPRPVSLDRLVADMRPLLEHTLGEASRVEIVSDEAIWTTSIDPSQLESAILNLALNARDAMAGGGALRIETRNLKIGRDEASHDLLPGSYVLLSVSDEGAGMDAGIVDRAFDPFFTTKDVGKGSGLGLSMVYGFVKQSGGHLQIDSEIDSGTTVRIYLPRTTSGPVALAATDPADVEPLGRGELVLVVEDNPEVALLTVHFLELLGYRTAVATSAAAALERLDEMSGVELLFTDVGLPGGTSGVELARSARARFPELRILLTSGYAHDRRVLDPDLELLEKPFSKAELARSVRAVLDA
jgi:PAS domain S-box-containing protein